MKKLFYLTAIVGFVMVSCAKPNDNPNPNEEKMYSIKIGAEKEGGGTDETRVEYVDGLMHWSVGDQVGLSVHTITSIPRINISMSGLHTEPTRITTFVAELTQSQISSYRPTETYYHYSYYPYRNNMSYYGRFTNNPLAVGIYHNLPDRITVRPNEFPMDNVYMVAHEDGPTPPMTWLENGEQKWGEKRTFTYKYTMAYLRVKINENLSGRGIDRIRVNNSVMGSASAIRLSGTLIINTNYNNLGPACTDIYYGSSYEYVEVDVDGGMDVGDHIYIPIPPNRMGPYMDYGGGASATLQFQFLDNGGNDLVNSKMLPVTTTPIILEAGKIYDIAFNL